MFEWILIIAILAAIFYAKDLPALKNKTLKIGSEILKKAKEKKAHLSDETVDKEQK